MMIPEGQNSASNSKMRNLYLGLLFDGIGMLSYIVPGIGDLSDVIWAPIAAYLMTKMYKGTVGKVAAIYAFLEEIIPLTDIIPSFTITWFYYYYIAKENS